MTYLLLLTGCRLTEILEIKVDVIYHLMNSNSIPIDRKKGGSKLHKAYINKNGKKLFTNRKDDIIILLQNLNLNISDFSEKIIKKDQLNLKFLFQGQKKDKPLSRATFTLQYNKMLSEVPLFKQKNLIIKSHSFRAGYITELWQKSGDIEFVRQVIGHSSVVSTMGYINKLSSNQI